MAAMASPRSTLPPLVGSVIDNIGMGPYQWKEGILSSCVWLTDGAELLLIGSVTRAMEREWDLTATQKGGLVSIVFLGVLLGNMISGPCSDRIGRRWPTVISYASIGIFSVLSAFTTGFWTLCALRFFVGVSFGFGQPASLSYCLEVTPTSWRTFVYCFSGYLFLAGEAYSACIIMVDDPNMNDLDWRWLLIVGALPSFVFALVSAAFLNESPSWLASQGKEEDAMDVLVKMNKANGSPCARLEFSTAPRDNANGLGSVADMQRDFRAIFGPTMLYSTLVSCFTCFGMNLLFYGGLYAFPQVLSKDVKTGSSPAFALLMGALWEAPGYLVAYGCDRIMGRRPTIILGQVCLITCVLAFVHGGSSNNSGDENRLEYYMVHFGYAGYKCFGSLLFVTAYQYASEIYPVSCRVTGSGLSLAMGRMGACSASLGFEWTKTFFGTWTTFFHILAGILMLDVLLVTLLPFETRGRTLTESVEDLGEGDPLCPCLERSKQV